MIAMCIGEPPECCHPAPTFRELVDAVKARQPRECPRCGSDAIAPTFDGEVWACDDCPNVWEVAP